MRPTAPAAPALEGPGSAPACVPRRSPAGRSRHRRPPRPDRRPRRRCAPRPSLPHPRRRRRRARARALAPEDQKAHEDAKRFARLVVSEIKLYNEAKVTEGRKTRDIYERLKEDIERGRQMYTDRVPAPVRDASDYFQDELVRILAGGDAAALGRQ